MEIYIDKTIQFLRVVTLISVYCLIDGEMYIPDHV